MVGAEGKFLDMAWWQGRLLTIFWLALLAGPLRAQMPLYVEAEESAFKADFVQALLDVQDPDVVMVAKPDQAELVIAMGDQAFLKAKEYQRPFLGVYVSRALSEKLQRKGCHCAAIWAGVALDDQLEVVQTMLPLARRVGVIIGPQSVWSAAHVEDYRGRLALKLLAVESQRELGEVLRDKLADLDAIVLPVDDTLFDPGAAKLVLLTSYRQRKPVFGPDQGYVRAGSAATLYASGGDLVAETLVHLRSFHRSKRLRRAGFVHIPSVLVNEHVANSFDMRFRDTDALREALEVQP